MFCLAAPLAVVGGTFVSDEKRDALRILTVTRGQLVTKVSLLYFLYV
jgi:hypothetical protein